MITAKEFSNREFDSKESMFKCLAENKAALISLKKNQPKFADAVGSFSTSQSIDTIIKAEAAKGNPDELEVSIVINTTKIMDSHGDVHLDGIWKRSLQHSSKKLHLQEHKRSFDAVISNDANAYVKTMTWKELGADFEGSTQALVFDSVVKRSRNPVMFEQYKNGWVNNHSVGMQYVDIALCIDSEEKWAKEYKENFDNYISEVANKDEAQEAGYFWAVKEAKILEGSAVLFGSNWVTPTISSKSEQSPSNESAQATQEKQLEKVKLNF